MKIGIIGLGFVGGSVHKYFLSKKYQPLVYDKYKNLGSPEEVNLAEIVFICVPTPFCPPIGFDISVVKESIKLLKGKKTIVIKSSILPGTTNCLQQEFSQHKILFNPEFLREVSARRDFIKPDRQIIGFTKQSQKVARKVLNLLPNAPYKKIMLAEEAEMVKYMANSFLALKVVFANEFYEICRNLAINYDQVREAVVKDPRIGDSHFDVAHGGYRGYGGSCFPKDVNAVIQLAESKKVKIGLLKAMRNVNRRLLKQSGLDEKYFLMEKHKRKS